MGLKKSAILLFMLILVNQVYAAEGMEVDYWAVKDKALVGDKFIFSVQVENTKNETDGFRFYSPLTFFEWIFKVEPRSLFIDPFTSETATLYLEPYDWDEIDPGNYAITMNLQSVNYSDQEEELVFNVEILTHDQVIDSILELPNTIDSSEANLFRIKLNNNYDFKVENLSLGFESEYFSERVDNITLDDEEIEKAFLVSFGDRIEEGETEVHILIYQNDELVIDRIEKFNVGASGDVIEHGSPERGFLFYKETIERVNDKNAVSFESVSKKLTLLEHWFTEVSEEPTSIIKQEGEYLYTWDFSLEPGEGKSITLETDFRAVVFGLIALLVIIWLLYLFFKKDIFITKKIVSVQHSKDNVSTVRIMLLIKNKSLARIKNLKVMDGSGNVIEKPFNFGSLVPSKIFKSPAGTKLLWEISQINAGEEIAISYTIKVKTKVIGNLPVHQAVAKYMKGRRRRLVKSNKLSMFS